MAGGYEKASTSGSHKHQHSSSELYNMLTAPKSSHSSPVISGESSTGIPTEVPGELKWIKLEPPSVQRLLEVPEEVIRNTCREKRSRGYIARMLAAKRPRTSQVASEHLDGHEEEDEDFSRKKVRRSVKQSFEPSSDGPGKNTALKRWRVKTVVDNHIETMRALSQLTINMAKMPGDLKHMDLKPRLLGSDRIAILQYQDTMRTLLTEEHEILREIHERLREAALEHNLPEEEARAEAEEAADQLNDYC